MGCVHFGFRELHFTERITLFVSGYLRKPIHHSLICSRLPSIFAKLEVGVALWTESIFLFETEAEIFYFDVFEVILK